MSQTLAKLKRQIGSASELQSVVRTMKAMAASNITQFENSARALSDYTRTVELGLGVCFRSAETGGAPPEPPALRDTDMTAAIVFGSDQGLVGQFNRIVAEETSQTLARLGGEQMIWTVGDRVHAHLADTGSPSAHRFNVPNTVKAIAPLVGQLLVECQRQIEKHPATQLILFYNRTTAGARYEPVNQRLLPLDQQWRQRRSEVLWPTGNLPQIVGDPMHTVRKLTSEYLFVSLYRACAESLAAENSSRLAAMQRADQNIEELLSTLNASFHRQRQGRIDEELFDVVAGFESLPR